MWNGDLWNYCTREQCNELLLSFRLFGDTDWPRQKQLAALYALSNDPDSHYSETRIPKPGGGYRSLSVPDSLLKQAQHAILRNLLEPMTVSPYATAYRKGTGILSNALPHREQPLLLKLDIQDFFGCILFPMVYRGAFSAALYPPAVGMLLTSLCCCRECLPQGAPTSAAISNLVMRPFDTYMGKWCSDRQIVYTRYCDDMAFTGDFNTGEVIRRVRGFLDAMGFSLNRKKTRILTRHNRQQITGIVVNEKCQVSRSYRSKLRQEVYYCVKYGAASHLERLGMAADEAAVEKYFEVLTGKLNHVLYVNPNDEAFRVMRAQVAALLPKPRTGII